MKMKTKVLIMALVTLLFVSCWKSYFADRPPKKWNNDYVDPKYIWDHRNSLAMGDTVMVWGWLASEESENGFAIMDDTNFVWNGNAQSICHYVNIRTNHHIWLPNVEEPLNITLPDPPCKVCVVGKFYHFADECYCDRLYCIVPTREEDVIFEPVNTEI